MAYFEEKSTKKRAPRGKKPKYNLLTKRIWIGFGVALGLLMIYLFAVRVNLFWLFGRMPDLVLLENPKNEIASVLLSEDGKILGKYYTENRVIVDYDSISPKVVDALLSTEDVRFLKHSGIDLRSLGRVIVGVITFRPSTSGGGSTLTQQVAKNLFDTRSKQYRGVLGNIPGIKILINKTKEWMLSIIIERKYTKREIIEMYLNTVSFGNNTYGIKVAANSYFGKEPSRLNEQEAAVLVGILQNPTYWNPLKYADRATQRRNVVLGQMKKYEFISSAQFDKLKSVPLGIKFATDSHYAGIAPYFRASTRTFLSNWIANFNKENGTDYNIYTSGLRIYTTIDSRMQQYMEEAVRENMAAQQDTFNKHWQDQNPWRFENGKEIPDFIENSARRTPRFQELVKTHGEQKAMEIMKTPYKMRVFAYDGEKEVTMSPIDSIAYYKHFLRTGMVSMDPKNGHIKAWVGDVDFKFLKYDHVKQGKRQPGSTFKPFVYLAAIDRGFLSPCDSVMDQPYIFTPEDDGVKQRWEPRNSNRKFSYQWLKLRTALGQSINSVSAFLIKEVGPGEVVKYANRLGISSKLNPQPAIALGTSDVSLFEMVAAYSAFANGGNQIDPMTITRIEDRNGNLLQELYPKYNPEISSQMAYKMLYLLRGATEIIGGSSTSLGKFGVLAGNEVAAKTGTTSNYSDGWFMGMTSNLVTGVWVGGEDRSIHFRTMALGQGAKIAMPAWGIYMKKVYADKSLGDYKKSYFTKPEGFTIDCEMQTPADSLPKDIYIPPTSSQDEGTTF